MSKKPPREPKTPLTAQQLFVRERSSAIRVTHPNLSSREVQDMANGEWDDLSPNDREPWLSQEDLAAEKYRKAYERFQLRKARYQEAHPDSGDDEEDEDGDFEEDGRKRKKSDKASGKAKKKKKEKDPNMPKKGLNPYMIFSRKRVKEIRVHDPKVQQKDALRMASAEWKAMSDAQKKPYLDAAEKDKIRHQEELRAYLESRGEDPDVHSEHRAPKKGLNPYMFFSRERVKEIRAQNPDIQQKDALRMATAQWKTMSDHEKRPYLEMAEKDKIRHQEEMAEFQRRQVQ